MSTDAKPDHEGLETRSTSPEHETLDPAPVQPSPYRARKILEAILFASREPIEASRLSEAIDNAFSTTEIGQELDALDERWKAEDSPFQIQQVAGGYQIRTRPEFAPYILRIARKKKASRLSPALLETLAIVAYRQPILRADIDAIRGVDSGALLRKLMERKLVRIVKREDVLGKPILYGTTRKFLEEFALQSIRDLPGLTEMRTETGDPVTTEASTGQQPGIQVAPEEFQAVADRSEQKEALPPILRAIPPLEEESEEKSPEETPPR